LAKKQAMTFPFIPRTLLLRDTNKTTELHYSKLDPENGPIVVLGEAGIGKSRLLEQMAEDHGWQFILAKEVIWQSEDYKNTKCLLIDALDEYPNTPSCDPLTEILKCLIARGKPPFIISCRSSDWSEAEHAELIESAYSHRPRQLHLKSLADMEARQLLQDSLPEKLASLMLSHLERYGLTSWLGNPHTLGLVIESAKGEVWPSSRTELFEQATLQLISEHKNSKAREELCQSTIISLGGAVCASLLLTGNAYVSRLASANLHPGDMSLTELSRIPGSENIDRLLRTRLFKTVDTDRFECLHRSIAEFLAARWLIDNADSPRKRRRLLSMFHHGDIVPTHLRAIHAWLVQAPELAEEVIRWDPTSLIDHGDIACLKVSDAARLLYALKEAYSENPQALSYWRPQAAIGLFREDLLCELKQLVADKCQPTNFRLLILESLKTPDLLASFKQTLSQIVLDRANPYGVRALAAESLVPLMTPLECTHHLSAARDCGHDNSIRLALDLACLTDFVDVDDELTAELIIACARQDERFGEIPDRFNGVHLHLPRSRWGGVLDCLVNKAPSHAPSLSEPADLTLYDVFSKLMLGVLSELDSTPEAQWRWFQYIRSFEYGGLDFEVTQRLQDDAEFRQALQHHVLFESQDNRTYQDRAERLGNITWILACSELDAIALLDFLNPEDEQDDRWKVVVMLVQHTDESGGKLRAAARRFAAGHQDRLDWLEAIILEPDRRREMHERYRIKQQLEVELATAKSDKVVADHDREIEQVRNGSAGYLLAPALVYLNLYEQRLTGESGYSRVLQWGNETLASATITGFDAYLKNILLASVVEDMASKCINIDRKTMLLIGATGGVSPAIVLAAISERVTNGKPFNDLSDEALLAAFLSLQHLDRYSSDLTLSIETELARRNLLNEAFRLWIEPSLVDADSLLDLALDYSQHYEQNNKIIASLACDWLQELKNLSDSKQLTLFKYVWEWMPEIVPTLLAHYASRTSEHRPVFFEAAQVLVHFGEASALLAPTSITKDFLFYITLFWRPTLDVDVIAWVFSNFRVDYPMVDWVKGDFIDTEVFNGSEPQFLRGLIWQLGDILTPAAIEAMNLLCEAPSDSYTKYLIERRAYQRHKVGESTYIPLSMDHLIAITQDNLPRNGNDLQAYILEQLADVQRRIRNDDVNSWKHFYKDDKLQPHKEEHCRDRLLGLLLQVTRDIDFETEKRVSDERRVDIMCKIGSISLPIEIKRSWNDSIWDAADKQLDASYSSYHSASGLGIYLVLWFGTLGKKTSKPKDGAPSPTSANQLAEMLIARSSAAKEGRAKVVVLDVSR
jgi:hypothetical protein